MDTFHWQIVLPGGMVSVPLGVYFRGNYKTVYIDVLITVAGDGLRGFLMTVDGNSPTEWIPQPSAHGLEVPQAVDYITDIHITDTTRLVLSGKHTFTFVDNNEGYPQTLDIYVRPKMLS